eukprot:gene4790-16361_t
MMCETADQCHENPTCDATTGKCARAAPKPDGTSCNDNLMETSDDK